MDKTYNLNGGFKPTVKRFADISGADFFPTPSWATHALVDNEHFEGDIWECALIERNAKRVCVLRHGKYGGTRSPLAKTRSERTLVSYSRDNNRSHLVKSYLPIQKSAKIRSNNASRSRLPTRRSIAPCALRSASAESAQSPRSDVSSAKDLRNSSIACSKASL